MYVLSRHYNTTIYALIFYCSHSTLSLDDMGTTRKMSTTDKDKNDFSQGLRCLAHLIAETYLRKEKEKLKKGEIYEENNNGNQ